MKSGAKRAVVPAKSGGEGERRSSAGGGSKKLFDRATEIENARRKAMFWESVANVQSHPYFSVKRRSARRSDRRERWIGTSGGEREAPVDEIPEFLRFGAHDYQYMGFGRSQMKHFMVFFPYWYWDMRDSMSPFGPMEIPATESDLAARVRTGEPILRVETNFPYMGEKFKFEYNTRLSMINTVQMEACSPRPWYRPLWIDVDERIVKLDPFAKFGFGRKSYANVVGGGELGFGGPLELVPKTSGVSYMLREGTGNFDRSRRAIASVYELSERVVEYLIEVDRRVTASLVLGDRVAGGAAAEEMHYATLLKFLQFVRGQYDARNEKLGVEIASRVVETDFFARGGHWAQNVK